jgi:hypothetical protein
MLNIANLDLGARPDCIEHRALKMVSGVRFQVSGDSKDSLLFWPYALCLEPSLGGDSKQDGVGSNFCF